MGADKFKKPLTPGCMPSGSIAELRAQELQPFCGRCPTSEHLAFRIEWCGCRGAQRCLFIRGQACCRPESCPCRAVSVCKGRQGPLRLLAQCVQLSNCQRWSGQVTAWGPWTATHSYLIKQLHGLHSFLRWMVMTVTPGGQSKARELWQSPGPSSQALSAQASKRSSLL